MSNPKKLCLCGKLAFFGWGYI